MKKINLILGTAMWGWTVSEKNAMSLLDAFYTKGFRDIDCATNYPINQNPNDFRKSELILNKWITSNNVEDLRIISKIGSESNLGTSDINLSSSYMLMNLNYYQHLFKNNLHTIMVHWDNRNETSKTNETIETLKTIESKGVSIGLSGIKFPELYLDLVKKSKKKISLELKHNIFNSQKNHYSALLNKTKNYVYGINAGGIKLKNNYTQKSSFNIRNQKQLTYQPLLKELTDVFKKQNIKDTETAFKKHLFHSTLDEKWINSIIIGPSKLTQFEQIKLWYNDYYESKN